MITKFEESYNLIVEKVKEFDKNIAYFKNAKYLEAEVRKDFIDPLFTALGWDVDHIHQKNPYKQEVKIEKSQIQEGQINKKFADYAFYLTPDFKNPVFFVEAKKPSVLLDNNREYYLQTHKYGWNAQVPISILTDFEEFIIIDCRSKPNVNYSHNTAIKKYNYLDFLNIEKFKELYYLFSREAVEDNSIQNFVETQIPQIIQKARQLKLFPGAYKTVDDEFLDYIDTLRLELAKGFVKNNHLITSQELTEATQKTIDRLVFIRFLEDKQIEFEDHISQISKWDDFISLSKTLDLKYNGVVFKPSIIDNPNFKGIDDGLFLDFCIDISSKESPYHFNAIPVHIIGNIYERFLGKLVVVNKGKVSIELKPEVRKAGGVFYTPKYIVDYLVQNTVGKCINNKLPKDIDNMSFADISCGSGSFLIGVYENLIDYHKEYYHHKLEDKTKLNTNNEDFGNVEFREGNWVITLKRKQELLLNCIYGVDIDNQAVEVTQLSLFLKLLEDESISTTSNMGKQRTLFSKVLPDLSPNIKCGNSLVDWDVCDNLSLTPAEEKTLNPFNFRSSFKNVFRDKLGFDVIVGNPPYVKEGRTDKKLFEYVKNSYLKKYYQGKMDLWYFFTCNGIDLLNNNGLLGFIAPNNWTTNAGASIMRNKIINDSQIIEMIDFGNYMVFKDASIQTMTFIIQKSRKNENYALDYLKLTKNNNTHDNAINLINKEYQSNSYILSCKINRKKFIDNYILFGNKEVTALLTKLKKESNFTLDKKKEIAQGIVTPQDTVNKKSSKIINKQIGKGVFILTNKELSSLNLTSKELNLIKPLFTTAQTFKYLTLKENNFWIIYTNSSYKNPESLDEYPILKKHLDSFQPIITSSNKPYGLHRARKEDFFKGTKIISLRKCSNEPTFSYANFDTYLTQTYNIIKTNRINQKYLVAILNSKLVKFWLLNKGKMQGVNYQIDGEPLAEIPIVKTKNKELTSKLIENVDDIIQSKKGEYNSITSSDKDFYQRKVNIIEQQIDSIVYKIYNLSKEEISLIEAES
jgi:adenine-specific DNA-methyltransferase